MRRSSGKNRIHRITRWHGSGSRGNGSIPRSGRRPANKWPSIPGTAWPSIGRLATSTAPGATSITRWRSSAATASKCLQVLDDGLTILGRQVGAIEVAAVAIAPLRRIESHASLFSGRAGGHEAAVVPVVDVVAAEEDRRPLVGKHQ